MSKEWYLLNSPYNQLSGYENDALNDFGEEGFLEVLETNVASDVELCNYDLSEIKPMRVVIQRRTEDTKLKALTRHMLAPIGTCRAGMYVKYKNRCWLIVGIVDDNAMYEKAVLTLCNWLLTWVNSEGQIIQRWANVVSASQYNNGETGMMFYFVRSDQLLVSLPDDDESLLLSDGCRFIIDKRCQIYERNLDGIDKDTSNPLVTYKLTRSDTVLYNYIDSGHTEFIATQDEQHPDDGFYRINGVGYWLCKNHDFSANKNAVLSSSILYDSTVIYNGLEAGIFTAKFTDSLGATVDIVPHWSISCEFADKLEITETGKSISISVNDNRLINKSFELFLDGSGYATASITITIKSFL